VRELDDLLSALTLTQVGDNRFRAGNEPRRFSRVFGGQLLGQALVAAAMKVADRPPSVLHATFVRGADPEQTLDIEVVSARDGRSTATCQVIIRQAGQPVLVAVASFHDSGTGADVFDAPPEVPGPEQVPALHDWARAAANGRTWLEVPPPLEMRIGEPPTFLGGSRTGGPRTHWLRLPRQVPGRTLNAALLAYSSDYFLLDMVTRSTSPADLPDGSASSTSDHTIWFHRLVHLDRWHLYVQRTVAVVGLRGLVTGAVYDDEGRLVATTMQVVVISRRATSDASGPQ
jgi:acyl-CoA thioesterase-2